MESQKIMYEEYLKALEIVRLYEEQNTPAKLSDEEVIQKCFELGITEVLEYEAIPMSNCARIKKVQHTFEDKVLVREIEYVNGVDSNSVFAIKEERRELL